MCLCECEKLYHSRAYDVVSMEVAASALDYLLIEAPSLAKDVSVQLGIADDDQSDEVGFRVEQYGYRVGSALAHILTRDRPPLTSELDIMKFICKDLWINLYKKQMDNLKTNHRDTYVLIDGAFPPGLRMSTDLGPQKTVELAAPYLWFPAGTIRGFLAGMGVAASVAFECTQLPLVSFTVVLQKSP